MSTLELGQLYRKASSENDRLRRALKDLLNHPAFEMTSRLGYDPHDEPSYKRAQKLITPETPAATGKTRDR